MHHTLRFYGRYRESILRFYMFGARMTRIPVAGHLVRYIANRFGEKGEGAYLLTPAEAEAIVAAAGGLAVSPCTCRKVFHNCGNPLNTELLLGHSREAFMAERPQENKEISREAALQIVRDAHKRGLVQTVIKCGHHFYALCNCCACCCVPLRMKRDYGIGKAVIRHKDIVAEFKARTAE